MRCERISAIAILLVLFSASCAAGEAVVGKWACISNDGSGNDLAWTLTIKEDEGKLAGFIGGDMGDVPLIDPKLDGNLFTFKFKVNDNCTVETRLKVDGNKFEGTFACPEVSGTMRGAKKI